MVFNVHEKADKVTGVIKPDGRGKHCNHHRGNSEDKENFLAYINLSLLLIHTNVEQKSINNT